MVTLALHHAFGFDQNVNESLVRTLCLADFDCADGDDFGFLDIQAGGFAVR